MPHAALTPQFALPSVPVGWTGRLPPAPQPQMPSNSSTHSSDPHSRPKATTSPNAVKNPLATPFANAAAPSQVGAATTASAQPPPLTSLGHAHVKPELFSSGVVMKGSRGAAKGVTGHTEEGEKLLKPKAKAIEKAKPTGASGVPQPVLAPSPPPWLGLQGLQGPMPYHWPLPVPLALPLPIQDPRLQMMVGVRPDHQSLLMGSELGGFIQLQGQRAGRNLGHLATP